MRFSTGQLFLVVLLWIPNAALNLRYLQYDPLRAMVGVAGSLVGAIVAVWVLKWVYYAVFGETPIAE